MNDATHLLNYTLQLADNALIFGHRISEWCGHGPVLEQDIALTNTALDHIGQARSLYQYAAEQYVAMTDADKQVCFNSPMLDAQMTADGKVDEDDMAYLRDAWDFKNVLLAEQLNGDWAYTVARSFFYDCFQFYHYTALQNSSDSTLASIAEKSLKEATYHLKWSSEWMIRLGDGTEESAARLQEAVSERWAFTGELFTPSTADVYAVENGIAPDLSGLKGKWLEKVEEIFEAAHLLVPTNAWMQSGGKTGVHSEHLGFLLAEMQYMQRAYPGMEW